MSVHIPFALKDLHLNLAMIAKWLNFSKSRSQRRLFIGILSNWLLVRWKSSVAVCSRFHSFLWQPMFMATLHLDSSSSISTHQKQYSSLQSRTWILNNYMTVFNKVLFKQAHFLFTNFQEVQKQQSYPVCEVCNKFQNGNKKLSFKIQLAGPNINITFVCFIQ